MMRYKNKIIAFVMCIITFMLIFTGKRMELSAVTTLQAAADKIDSVISGCRYEIQANRVIYDGGSKSYYKSSGICNVCSMVNLLNRNLALDGYYSDKCRFTMESTINSVTGNADAKKVSVKFDGRDSYTYTGDTAKCYWANYTITSGSDIITYQAVEVPLYTTLNNCEAMLARLLDEHPAGLFFYGACGVNSNHAILLSYYTKSSTGKYTFYAIDPIDVGYADGVNTKTKYKKLDSTYLGSRLSTIYRVAYLEKTVVSTKSYTVKFDANGGSCSVSSMKVSEGNKCGSFPLPTKAGYEFLGWYSAKEGGTRLYSTMIVNKDRIVYAHWKKLTSNTYIKMTSVPTELKLGQSFSLDGIAVGDTDVAAIKVQILDTNKSDIVNPVKIKPNTKYVNIGRSKLSTGIHFEEIKKKGTYLVYFSIKDSKGIFKKYAYKFVVK